VHPVGVNPSVRSDIQNRVTTQIGVQQEQYSELLADNSVSPGTMPDMYFFPQVHILSIIQMQAVRRKSFIDLELIEPREDGIRVTDCFGTFFI
jgi:hypothetical protein